jgi:para-nitrobenzyl esterase
MKKLSFLLLIAVSHFAFAQTDAPIVKISNGTLQGVAEASGIHSFKGIPFAQPPVGDLRWKEPQPPLNWTGVRKADHFGHQAMQLPIYSDMQFRSDGKSEDCLYLNVWTSAKTTDQKLPVLVYFYGGGFSAGDGSEYRYDGESLAKKGIVTVTINYRLGIFGFLAHPELTQESAHHSSGNYGLMDQHAALLWVQKNIAAFGGDPNHVTIAGESAGSMSVSAQVASPLSKSLFIGAIAESGSVLGTSLPMPLSKAEDIGVKFAQKIGAVSLSDLRKIPADSLLKLAAGSHFPSDIDGYFLPESPKIIFDEGLEMHVPLLVGWNSAEVDYHGVIGNNTPTVSNYKAALQRLYNTDADDAFKYYPAATDSDVKVAATNLAADRFIVFNTWEFAQMQTKTGERPVYQYLFAHTRPAMADGKRDGNTIGASHASEIEFALGNLATNKVYTWTPDDYKVSATMEHYFANFIKTGNPNSKGLPQWYSLQTAPPRVMVINVSSHSEPITNTARYIWLYSVLTK